MADEMKNAIKGNDHLDIRAVAEAGDAAIAANIEAANSVTVADTAGRYTGTNVEACLAEIAGDGRLTETVKGNATAISANAAAISKLNGMYAIQFVGADADPDPAFCGAISVLTPGAVPAVGDKIIAVISARVTANMAPVAYPAIVATEASNGFVQLLALDGENVKVRQGAGSDLSANTYCALVLRA